jgi:selenocysteine lyase/cysteine desulfurase
MHRLRPRLVDLHSGRWEGPQKFALREDARVFEIWEHSVADRLGLIAAARYALDLGLDAIADEIADRAQRLRAGLAETVGATVRDQGVRRCGIVTFTIDGVAAAEVKERLGDKGITVSTSGASSTLLDMTRRGLDAVVRASPHYFVSPRQIERALDACRVVGC